MLYSYFSWFLWVFSYINSSVDVKYDLIEYTWSDIICIFLIENQKTKVESISRWWFNWPWHTTCWIIEIGFIYIFLSSREHKKGNFALSIKKDTRTLLQNFFLKQLNKKDLCFSMHITFWLNALKHFLTRKFVNLGTLSINAMELTFLVLKMWLV